MPSRGCFGALLLAVLATELAAAGNADHAAKLEALAAKCDQLGLTEQAAITRNWHIARHRGRQYLYLPDDVRPEASKSAESDPVQKWRENFLAVRRERAASLFDEATRAVEGDKAAYAYQLLHEVLREDPDHAEARRILGYRKQARGGWSLSGAATDNTPTQPRFAHPKLAWQPRTYWRLETPHFSITTNHSADAAKDLGEKLEKLNALWRQVYFDYWSTAEGLKARFDGGSESLARTRPKHQVVLFASREQYLVHLRPVEPQIDLTSGIYLDRQRTSYFYAGDPDVEPTWQHEATHQLFQEVVPDAVDRPGQSQNFWAIEGVAMYMESLAPHEGFWTVGGCEADRVQFARYRALAGDFAPPLERTAALGREQVQRDPDIRKWYAHFAGLVHFLMDGEQGRHRPAFIRLLTMIYRGQDRGDSLALLTETNFDQLNEQYFAWLKLTDVDLAGIPSPPRLKNLSLGNTNVTDAGLAHLAGCTSLEWLDVSRTKTTDKGLARLSQATMLKQLFLEGTLVTEESFGLIATLTQLEELDLTRLQLSDAALAKLEPLKKLKILHLAHTPVSDEAIPHLAKLKNLDEIDTSGTRITADGLQQLRTALPNLQTQ